MKDLPYDKYSARSIELYAKELEGHTFKDILEKDIQDPFLIEEEVAKYDNPRSKGSLGNLVERHHFYYEPNSNPEPDFPEAGVELKVTPYERLKSGKFKAGERLSIGMIPNESPIEPNFEDSHVLDKISLILLILYFRDRKKARTDYQIDYVKLFSILSEALSEDLEIIKSDYQIIMSKIISGNAHELSESDTMYLGAATKGATAVRSLQPQYYNPSIPAKRRAFSLKQGYMTYVLQNYILKDVTIYDAVVDESVSKEEFENIVISKILKYKDKSVNELQELFNLKKGKDTNNRIVLSILGIKSDEAEEFVKSNTEVKTIRINSKGKIVENMSFPSLDFLEFAKEDWEESEVYHRFTETRYLFVIFREIDDDYILEKAVFWNMPMEDLETIGKNEWIEIQDEVRKGITFEIKNGRVLNSLPKMSKSKIFHVRPHTGKRAYRIQELNFETGNLKAHAALLPNGDMMTKQSFWLKNSYILKQISK